MRTLLLGATGLIGQPLCEALVARGDDVTVLSRRSTAVPAGARAIEADRYDRESLRALEGQRFDLTVDLLAYTAEHVAQLFSVSRFAPGRVVMMSTGQVYLVTEREPPFREEDFDAPVIAEPEPDTRAWHNWKYGVEKRQAEQALRRAASERGIEAIAMRVPVVQGELDGQRTQRLWAWIERILDGGPVLLPEGGEQRLRFVYAGDIARAVLSLSERPTWEGVTALNVAMPNECTLRSFVERVAACLERSPEWVEVSGEQLDAAEIPRDFISYWGRYFSRPDPTMAIERFGLSPRNEDEWLASVVRAHLHGATKAQRSHDGYAHREREIALARGRTG